MSAKYFFVTVGTLAVVVAGCRTTYEEVNREACESQRRMLQDYVNSGNFGQRLPRFDGAEYNRLVSELDMSEQSLVRQNVDRVFEDRKENEVFPAWIAFKNKDIASKVDALTAQAKADAATNNFSAAHAALAKAREISWQESVENALDGKPLDEINVPVHAASVKLLNERVNIVHWEIIEREMRLIAADETSRGDFAKGIERIGTYPHIRTYTEILDQRVAAINNELARFEISGDARTAIAEKTADFMRRAARLADSTDDVRDASRVIKGKGGVRFDDTEYRRLLEEYRKALLKYDCTKINTERIVKWFSDWVGQLVSELPKPEPDHEERYKQVVSIGATAINARIDALAGELVKGLKAKAAEAAELDRKLREESKKDPAKARDRVLQILRGTVKSSESERLLARRALLTDVNPALWNRIRVEIERRTEQFISSGETSKGVAWLAKYPEVRVYPEDIDLRLDAVRRTMVSLGVSEPDAKSIVADLSCAASESEHICSKEDFIENRVTPGLKMDKEKLKRFEETSIELRESLIRSGCTVENADKIQKMLKYEFGLRKAAIEADRHEPVLILGANALNARLRALKREQAGLLLARVAATKARAGDFVGARKSVRQVAMTGDSPFDADVYAMRIGVLNTLVNPAQLVSQHSVISTQVEKLCKAGDYRALRKWIRNYPYVHDRTPDLVKSLEDMRAAMVALRVKAPEAEQYIRDLDARIVKLIDEATSSFTPQPEPYDTKSAELALTTFEKSFLGQYYDVSSVDQICKTVHDEVLGVIAEAYAVPPAMTTSELNDAQRAFIEEQVRKQVALTLGDKTKFHLEPDPVCANAARDAIVVAARKGMAAVAADKSKDEIFAEIAGGVNVSTVNWIVNLCAELDRARERASGVGGVAVDESEPFDAMVDRLVARQEYLEFLAEVDRQVDYDSQIAKAEDGIAAELKDRKSGLAGYRANALLGEYARAIRLLKQGRRLSKDEGGAVIVGAAYLNQQQVLDRAIELGAGINATCARDPLARTPLLMAIQRGHVKLLARIASAGGSAKVKDAVSDTPVHYAARLGDVGVLKGMLVKVDVNAVNVRGETALFDAARRNNPAVVKALVAAKVNVGVINAEGHTAFDAACEVGSCCVLDLLADAGATVSSAQLRLAAANGHLGVVQWLVTHGVDVNGDGVMAAAVKHPKVNDYLLHQGGIGNVITPPVLPAIVPPETGRVKLNIALDSIGVVEGKSTTVVVPVTKGNKE